MLVTRILGDCPSCGGKDKFGNVSVGGNGVLRGCMSCKYRIRINLPEIKKKILYLDQFFFSHAFRDRDARFVEAANRIRHVSSLQLLVAPFSSIHEDETHQWQGNEDALMEFIKATSRGHEFEPDYDVERTQIVRAFQSFLREGPHEFKLDEGDIVEADVHEWDDYFWIDAGRYVGDIELMHNLKQESVQRLVDIFPNWRESNNTFEQDVSIEINSAARGYVNSYLEYATRIAKGDYSALFDSPTVAMIVQSLLHCFPNEIPQEERLKKIGEFFKSSHFSEIPYQWIGARIFAVVKDMVKQGAYKNRGKAIQRFSGFFQDVKHIATYAPYCDAFVVDRPMASIVTDGRINLENRYGVNIFSLANWDQFLAWLDEIEEGMSHEHRAGLEAAYP